jgi:hypothetical protein
MGMFQLSDTFFDVQPLNAFNTQLINSDTTTNGNIIDTAGYDRVLFVFQMGVMTDGDYVVLLQHDSDSGLASPTTVAAADRSGDLPSLTDHITEDNTCQSVEVRPIERYVRLSIVSTNNAGSGATLGASALLFNARHKPQQTAAHGNATQSP